MATSAKCWLSLVLLAVAMCASDCVILSSNQLDQCGGHLTNQTGTISSPRYPQVYPIETSCEWTITADTGLGITLTFQEFQLDSGDTLKIYDNDPSVDSSKPKWSPFTGFVQDGTVYSTHFNQMWLVFTSNDETISQKAKFRIGYLISKTQCPDIDAPKNGSRSFGDSVHGYTVTFSCDDGYILRGNRTLYCVLGGAEEGRWSGAAPECITPCYSDLLLDKDGRGYFLVPSNKPVILSPKYPSQLGNPGKCTWKIQVKSRLYVNLTSTDFSLDNFSHVEIWDRSIGANLLGNFSGNNFPKYVTSSSYTLFINLYSSGPSVGHFSLKYAISNSTNCAPPANAENMYFSPAKTLYDLNDVVFYKCITGFVLAPKNSHNTKTKCSVGKRWTVASLPKCVAHCKEWNPDELSYHDMVYRNESGIIYSPGYPGLITKVSCDYRIEMTKGHNIEFDLAKVILDAFTTLTIYSGVSSKNGTLLVTVSATNLQKVRTFKSTYSTVVVVIEKTSGADSDKFSLRYQSITSGQCGKPRLENGYALSASNGFAIQSVVRLSCVPFFELLGASEIVCISGNRRSHWEPALPTCVSRCGGSYPLLLNGTIMSPSVSKNTQCIWHTNDPNPAQKGFSYSVSIKIDFLNLGQDSLVVQPLGLDGNLVAVVNNSPFVIVTSSAGFRVTFSSSTNKPAMGSKFILSYKSKAYMPKTCAMPPTSSHLWIYSGSANVGSTTTFRCKPPYNLVGAGKSTCSRDPPLWNPSLPICSLNCGMDGSGEFVRNASIDGAIANPGYPSMIRGRQNCRWAIHALPGYRVMASFSYLDFPKQHKDISVRIFDGSEHGHQKPVLVETQYGVLPPNVTSLSGSLIIDYTCSLGDNLENKGFYIRYSMVTFIPVVPRTTATVAPTMPTTTPPATKPTTTTSTQMPTVDIRTLPNKPVENTTEVQPDPEIENRVRKVQSRLNHRVSPGVVVAAVVTSIVLLICAILAGFYLYRRRHPARILVGQRFPKFHNPLYEHQNSTSSTLSLDKDFNLSTSSSTSLA